MSDNLGAALEKLIETVAARKGADPASSYTAQLLSAGVSRCAKKFGEEAVEAALAAVSGDKAELANEAADVLYHLAVMLEAAGVSGADIAAALAAREGRSGIEEKAARK